MAWHFGESCQPHCLSSPSKQEKICCCPSGWDCRCMCSHEVYRQWFSLCSSLCKPYRKGLNIKIDYAILALRGGAKLSRDFFCQGIFKDCICKTLLFQSSATILVKCTKGELVKFINIVMCTMQEIAFVSLVLIIICRYLLVLTDPSTKSYAIHIKNDRITVNYN